MTRILIDGSSNPTAKAYLFENPDRIICAMKPEEVALALDDLQIALDDGYALAGFFSYELGYVLEPKLNSLLPDKRKVPLLWFGVFRHFEMLDQTELKSSLAQWSKYNEKPDVPLEPYFLSVDPLSVDRDTYQRQFSTAQENIAAGDIYQLNLTLKSYFNFKGNPYTLYRDLKTKQGMSHGALIDTQAFTILSASPELFLDVQERFALTRPMKGTIRRGMMLEQDMQQKYVLEKDEKSRAENLMIVDLMRNDLARISEIGSVHVEKLFEIETYPTLHQMTSTVCSTLKEHIALKDWLPALFPPGSITGAPKLRAMELIRALEEEPRGIYTGIIGMILPEDRLGMDKKKPRTYFNVAIRTVTLWPNQNEKSHYIGEMGIGSGVVSDSSAESEYDECLLKMKFLTDPVEDFSLIETLMHDYKMGYLFYKEHLERLEKSAAYFNFPFDQKKVEQALADIKNEMKPPCNRVRLLLSAKGQISVTATSVPCPSATVMRFVISDKRMNSENVFLYHKTTNRAFYDDEHKAVTEKYGCDEVIFLNERGELTEGSRTNIFIERDGHLLTPAISCGVLAGTLRASLIEQGRAKEVVLFMQDLEQAETVYLGNSVRGLLRAERLRDQ